MIRIARSTCIAVALTAAWGSASICGDLRITVKNPSSVSRAGEPVVISWREIYRNAPEIDPSSARLTDEQARPVLVQIDDIDADGTPDELTFQADFASHASRTFMLGTGKADTAARLAVRTDAADYKRIGGALRSILDDDNPGNGRVRKAYRFDGVGWESDVIAYRLYLDVRNAVDILGKRKAGLYWDYIGTSGVDYQLDADWGTDVLHVGDALGIGGIGFWIGDSAAKPVSIDRQRTRILARGPVRAVVRVDYQGWQVGTHKEDVTSLFTIYAGDRVSEQRVTVKPVSRDIVVATGIVRHDSTSAAWDPKGGWLYTTGRQARFDDSLMMAVCVEPRDLVKRTRDKHNELLLLRPENQRPLRILLAAYWKGETGRMWDDAAIRKFLQAATLRLREPLTVRMSAPATGPR